MTSVPTGNSSLSIKQTVDNIKARIAAAAEKSGRKAEDITLMGVTKTVDPSAVNQAFSCGVTLFGENRVQEFLSKRELYNFGPENTHFIGHLQTNKVKYIIDKVSMIESVSSIKLMHQIDSCAKKAGVVMEILLEVNIGAEESKYGFLPEEVFEAAKIADSLENVSLRGLMTIPPMKDQDYYFAKMREIFVDISQKKLDNSNVKILSMGMSNDFETAILYGSNIVRIGSLLFGERNYSK